MVPFEDMKAEQPLFDQVAMDEKYLKPDVISDKSVKSIQFAKPCFQFSAACAGCAETTYIKLLSQLFGDHMYAGIAAVNGFALGGGCELAMSCDIILASEKAKFGQPEVGLGITPGFSGTQCLPRRVGVAKAKELIFSGRMVKADEAERIGLVNAVYAPEALLDGAMEMARSFAKNAPIAVKYAKACIDRGMQTDIDSGIVCENELFAMCFATADQKEGMGAFLEKRTAEFQNR